MKAIMVSVEYGDILSLTLPRNKHHFDRMMVVTSPDDKETQKVAKRNKVETYITDAFYLDGAVFNKWRAMEEALDHFGRRGWMTIMDADIIWPKKVETKFEQGNLYSPGRKILGQIERPLPRERDWRDLTGHSPDNMSFAGYTLIFHGSDHHLPKPPWHQIDWVHAGGADTLLQARWPNARKIRLDWDVLHLGPPCKNWCGRSTPRTDGSPIEGGPKRLERLEEFMKLRRYEKRTGGDKYQHERIIIHD